MTSRSDAPRVHRGVRAVAVLALLVVFATGTQPEGARAASTMIAAPRDVVPRGEDWAWPVRQFRLEQAFVAPPHAYGPGHRGVDLRLIGGADVMAPAAGVVAFSGQVAGRGILTIDHGDGLVTTLEPVQSDLAAGTIVSRGAEVGIVSTGGHAAAGTVHFGVRLDGEYINPLLLLGGVPRAILLPCC
ncbi:M23 family metallopeptidase [Microbacterium jejuense]|uniref:murein hydrolase activator EnvC family protein n=1 Tax=Microbacterium jejuense TaxID=1263637 RepID=UPI0031E7DFA3